MDRHDPASDFRSDLNHFSKSSIKIIKIKSTQRVRTLKIISKIPATLSQIHHPKGRCDRDSRQDDLANQQRNAN
jgi:hypothetical protein